MGSPSETRWVCGGSVVELRRRQTPSQEARVPVCRCSGGLGQQDGAQGREEGGKSGLGGAGAEAWGRGWGCASGASERGRPCGLATLFPPPPPTPSGLCSFRLELTETCSRVLVLVLRATSCLARPALLRAQSAVQDGRRKGDRDEAQGRWQGGHQEADQEVPAPPVGPVHARAGACAAQSLVLAAVRAVQLARAKEERRRRSHPGCC